MEQRVEQNFLNLQAQARANPRMIVHWQDIFYIDYPSFSDPIERQRAENAFATLETSPVGQQLFRDILLAHRQARITVSRMGGDREASYTANLDRIALCNFRVSDLDLQAAIVHEGDHAVRRIDLNRKVQGTNFEEHTIDACEESMAMDRMNAYYKSMHAPTQHYVTDRFVNRVARSLQDLIKDLQTARTPEARDVIEHDIIDGAMLIETGDGACIDKQELA